MWKVLVLKWDSLILSLVSIIYGVQLLLYPDILQSYKVYRLIDGMFDQKLISLTFVILGLMKLLGVVLNKKILKRFSLTTLSFLWMVFAISFLISPPANTVWIFSIAMALLAFGIALKEG